VTLDFADCAIDIGAHDLFRSGERVSLEPQVFDVLAYLIEHRERVVPKTELLDEIWGDRFVSESALTSRIKSARRAVGDTGREQRVIRTIHGRGFRFVATVASTTRVDRRPPPASTPGAAADPAPDVARLVARRLQDGEGLALAVTAPSARQLGHLVDDMYEAAATAGHLVGRGSGSGAGLRPYGCVIDAVDELSQRSPGLLERLPEGCHHELEAVLGGRQPSIRQRLFLGVRELLVAAAEQGATLLVVDELQYADPDTIALLDHCARLTRRRPLVVVAAHGPGAELSGPYEHVGLSAADDDHGAEILNPSLPPALADVLRTVALEGSSFDAALFRAAVDDDAEADRLLDQALNAGIIEPVEASGDFRFREPGAADDLVATMAPHRRIRLHRRLAGRLIAAGRRPSRIAHHLLAAHEPDAAVPYALAAAHEAGTAKRYPDFLRWTAAVLDHASGDDRRELLTLRAAALAGTGDPTAIQVYREAVALARPGEAVELRAGLARAAVLSGDLDTAADALDGLTETDAQLPSVLLVRAMLAYFRGDLDTADALLDQARSTTLAAEAADRVLDVIALQGLIAHNRGEWFDRLRRELRATRDSTELAMSIFDSHLCVAQYLLYGPTAYEEVISLATDLRRNAERSGARRAVAFAVCVTGEAKLLAGDVEGARVDLVESIRLHRELGADAGASHSLQRLAEVELVSGDPADARSLLREALALARWSPMSQHLLQRIYGTLIAAAPDRQAALAIVGEAVEVLDEPGSCEICQVAVEVPATIACAEAGRLDEARQHLQRARWSAGFWEGTAWPGAVNEAEAAIALAEGRPADAEALLGRATVLFEQAGQPLDAARCREAADDLAG
jgi:DNA-binding winged helix-turn-helix (wHTH) protein/tetratricopeptide (TPR) repeat protein